MKVSDRFRIRLYEKFIKRVMDFLLAIIALAVLFPVMFIIAMLVAINLGHPMIFKQQRIGLRRKTFTIYKFRTMRNLKDENGVLLDDSIRMTKLGAFLRTTSLDELPQLYNIVKGDMSFIGPRPMIEKYSSLCNNEQKVRFKVRPGLSGLAQINGRNEISYNERFNYDIHYVNNITFLNDLKIALKTFLTLTKSKSVNTQSVRIRKHSNGNHKQETYKVS